MPFGQFSGTANGSGTTGNCKKRGVQAVDIAGGSITGSCKGAPVASGKSQPEIGFKSAAVGMYWAE